MKRGRWLVLLLAVALLASGCSKKKFDSLHVIDFVDATSPHSYRIAYNVTEGKTSVDVQGIIQDDFRYKLQLSLNEKPAAEQVVVDDAVALRFFDSSLVAGYTDPAVKGKVKTDTDVAGATVFDALNAGRWVLDDAGAPSPILETQGEDVAKGVEAPKDPLFDTRTALSYVRRVAHASFMVKYDAESINPTYRKDEDPFPVPGAGSGVDRYDSVLFPLPSAAQATSSRVLPAAQNFRKMAVYVKHGKVIAVREFIGVTPRQAQQLADYEIALLKATANDAVVSGFRQQLAAFKGDEEKLDAFLLGGLNTFIQSTGAQPVRFRTMSFEITDLDKVTTGVDLPTDTVKGDLAVIRNLGRKPVDDGSSDPSSGG